MSTWDRSRPYWADHAGVVRRVGGTTSIAVTDNEAAELLNDLGVRVKELEDGLAMLAEGTTPWMTSNGDLTDAWELMAKYASQLLEGKVGL